MRFVLNIPLFPGPDLTCSVAQFQGLRFVNITATIALFIQVAPLAQTWITGLVAYNKPKRQGGQGRPSLLSSGCS